MKPVGVARFPGTNCDQDVWDALNSLGLNPLWLWHRDHFNVNDYSAVVIPGGFSYGDYLRCGALAARSPVMASVAEAVKKGVPILGICNGFQILCEANLLPGALVRNRGRRFIDKWVTLSLKNPCKKWGPESPGDKVRLPVAHGEGRFVIDQSGRKRIEERGQIWWTYNEDINGSEQQIAGVMNETKNVAALMPHPERAFATWMGGADGKRFFDHIQ